MIDPSGKHMPHQGGTTSFDTEHAKMPSPSIFISALDRLRLTGLMPAGSERRPAVSLLEKKLANANLAPHQEIPAGVVTMNSKVMFFETDTQAVYGCTLVYPGPGKCEGDVSVFAPVGAALLGLAVGREIHWWSTAGRRLSLRVLELIYQLRRMEPIPCNPASVRIN